MAICDLCRCACEAHMLETLPRQEQTSAVKDVCPKCSRWVDAVRRGIVAMIPGQIRDQIAARASEPPAMRWWERVVKRNTEAQRAGTGPTGAQS